MGRSSAAAYATCLVSLTGCHGVIREDWNPEPTLPPLEPIYMEVHASQLPSLCGDHPGMLLYGCAKRDYVMRECVIYTEPNPPRWLLDHERRHCAGWDHR